MKPGEIITKQNSDINLNDERQSITLKFQIVEIDQFKLVVIIILPKQMNI